jgi:hypothetical protein
MILNLLYVELLLKLSKLDTNFFSLKYHHPFLNDKVEKIYI